MAFIKRTTLADIPVICLEKILSNLGIQDLVVASKTNKALEIIANQVYRMKYDGKFRSENVVLNAIRKFGKHISNIVVDFEPIAALGWSPTLNERDKTRGKKLLKFIIRKCRRTLKQLEISETFTVELKRPFPNLETFAFRSYHLSENIHPSWFQYSQWFPNLRVLIIDDVFYNTL